ncbi:uncharacterized protein LOC141719067 [Apium graveolens]|uniref:uncharacterized protein LOC141699781 n=1 Tax=Apium graveolens TaxID=4045 RepID=UPI003D7ACF82
MDAYSGHNQILMHGPDQEHTLFITDRGLYCYIGMLFGLINIGATYQPLVNMIFKNQIGKTMEVYVDDMMVKCKETGDHKELAAVYHPRSNGQTEAVNKIIKHTLKTKLEECKWNWPEELPKVLWSYNTTPRSTTGESPFMLTYGYEVMVPVEVGLGLLHKDHYAEGDAEVNQRLDLDLLEEARKNSQLKLAAYQQRVARYYNKKVNGQQLKVGDPVL